LSTGEFKNSAENIIELLLEDIENLTFTYNQIMEIIFNFLIFNFLILIKNS